jgi:hypothetical protein
MNEFNVNGEFYGYWGWYDIDGKLIEKLFYL